MFFSSLIETSALLALLEEGPGIRLGSRRGVLGSRVVLNRSSHLGRKRQVGE